MNGWISINSEDDLPKEPRQYLFTVERKSGERIVTLMHYRNIWAGLKAVAYMDPPAPYEPLTKAIAKKHEIS
jgi:hypothetical protein